MNQGSAFKNFFWMEGPLPSDQGRRITVIHQNQPQQCSNCFGYSRAKYGGELGLCLANANGRACKTMGTIRAKMAPYMRELERLVGYKTIKAKFGNVGNMDENNPEEEEVDTTYKSPIVEKDEIISTLIQEKEDLLLEKEKLGKIFQSFKKISPKPSLSSVLLRNKLS